MEQKIESVQESKRSSAAEDLKALEIVVCILFIGLVAIVVLNPWWLRELY
jgi:hypothetical protein